MSGEQVALIQRLIEFPELKAEENYQAVTYFTRRAVAGKIKADKKKLGV
ncbi:MAG: hypothetical protein ACFFD2_07015 [Promethearchaeota archaeon]